MSLLEYVNRIKATALGAGLLGAGLMGIWQDDTPFASHRIWLVVAGVIVLVMQALQLTYYKSGQTWSAESREPKRFDLKWSHYLKALCCWLHAFQRTYAFKPGLYYIGERYDKDAPLLVTSNYLLTVFLLVRRLQGSGAVRLLVVDADGINVWCASSKGQMTNATVLAQLDRYDRELLTDAKWLKLILPKFALAGVDLRDLRRHKIRPVIGPLYASDLPAYLENRPFKDRVEERVHFGLQSRIFTWLPGLVQYMGYALGLMLILLAVEWVWGLKAPLAVIPLTAVICTAYPLLFPWIPGQRFAVKGLWLGAAICAAMTAGWAAGLIGTGGLVTAVLFAVATTVFFALSYTGNSAVSNYTRVRAEIARFLPITLLFYVAALIAFIQVGVSA